jgi:hypothetical protein
MILQIGTWRLRQVGGKPTSAFCMELSGFVCATAAVSGEGAGSKPERA